jgi:hypothetical protein
MRIRVLVAVLLAAVSASLATSASTAASHPPPGLTPAGLVEWNLDALVNSRFGAHRVCLAPSRAALVPARGFCVLPEREYTVIFETARGGSFRLVRRGSSPLAHPGGPNAEAVTVSGGYVSCGPGRWLAVVNAWTTSWPIACVAP